MFVFHVRSTPVIEPASPALWKIAGHKRRSGTPKQAVGNQSQCNDEDKNAAGNALQHNSQLFYHSHLLEPRSDGTLERNRRLFVDHSEGILPAPVGSMAIAMPARVVRTPGTASRVTVSCRKAWPNARATMGIIKVLRLTIVASMRLMR